MGALVPAAKGTHKGCPYKREETYAKLYQGLWLTDTSSSEGEET